MLYINMRKMCTHIVNRNFFSKILYYIYIRVKKKPEMQLKVQRSHSVCNNFNKWKTRYVYTTSTGSLIPMKSKYSISPQGISKLRILYYICNSVKCDNNNICDALSFLYGKIRIFHKSNIYIYTYCNCKINFPKYTHNRMTHYTIPIWERVNWKKYRFSVSIINL